jgi:predicted DNA-binding transcriptional regulator AlpA
MGIEDLVLPMCAACNHPRYAHGKNGDRCSVSNGVTSAGCWCRKFVTDFPEAINLIIANGEPLALVLGINRAIERQDKANAHRLLDQWLVKTPFNKQDLVWIEETRHRIRALTDSVPAELATSRATRGRSVRTAKVHGNSKSQAAKAIAVKLKHPADYPTMTLAEVRSVIPVSRSTIYRYVDEGKLKRPKLGKKIGRRTRFLVLTTSVVRMLQESDL